MNATLNTIGELTINNLYYWLDSFYKWYFCGSRSGPPLKQFRNRFSIEYIRTTSGIIKFVFCNKIFHNYVYWIFMYSGNSLFLRHLLLQFKTHSLLKVLYNPVFSCMAHNGLYDIVHKQYGHIASVIVAMRSICKQPETKKNSI